LDSGYFAKLTVPGVWLSFISAWGFWKYFPKGLSSWWWIKEGLMKRLIQYFKDSYAEMKKVMWPTKDEVSSSTVVVLVSVVIFAVLLGVIDFLLANLIEILF